MRTVKGTILLPWVKGIKSDKTGAFDNMLSDETKAALSKLLLPSSWYSFEIYRDCINAVAKVVAGNDAETLREWGRAYCESIMTSVYKRAIKKNDIKGAIEQFKFVFKSMFNFGKVLNEMPSENEMIVTLEDFEPDFELFYYVTQGWLERLIELCMDKPVRSEFLEKSWQSGKNTTIKASW